MSLANFKKFWLDFLFPEECLICHKTVQNTYPVCDACLKQISLRIGFICPVCFKKLPFNQLSPCPSCRPKTHLKALMAVGFYEDKILKELIHQFKYQNITSLAVPLAQLMIDHLEKYFPNQENNYYLVPIPLSRQKERQRGYNQSLLLAEIISQKLNYPLLKNILLRQKNTISQITIRDYQKRKENIKDAFLVVQSEMIKNKNILLIDDVFTSGATLEEAAKTLKMAGAKNIIGLVLAHG